MYFAICPDAAGEVPEETENRKKEETERAKQRYADIKQYSKSLSKAQLQEELLCHIVESEQNRSHW